MAAEKPSPERWTAILNRIDARLEEALAAAAERAARAPDTMVPAAANTARAGLEQAAIRLQIVIDSEARAEVVVREADNALAAAEDSLKEFQSELESLRQKLAASAGRAIG